MQICIWTNGQLLLVCYLEILFDERGRGHVMVCYLEVLWDEQRGHVMVCYMQILWDERRGHIMVCYMRICWLRGGYYIWFVLELCLTIVINKTAAIMILLMMLIGMLMKTTYATCQLHEYHMHPIKHPGCLAK